MKAWSRAFDAVLDITVEPYRTHHPEWFDVTFAVTDAPFHGTVRPRKR
jgi:hypothetical protein